MIPGGSLAHRTLQLAWMTALVVSGALSSTGCRSDLDDGTETRPYQACEVCQSNECNAARETCEADPDCTSCLATPYAFECIANENFQRLGACSCSECSSQCGHMCPVGQGACEACGVTACNAEVVACSTDAACSTCLANLGGPGCESNQLFLDFLACGCTNCGQECIWTCPNAVTECANCGLSACGDAYGDCIQDMECAACFDNPALEGCERNQFFVESNACICDACDPDCGVLFGCE